MLKKREDYLNFFNVSEEDAVKVLNAALEKGADWADIYFEYSLGNNLTMRDGIASDAGTHIDFGVGIRAVKGEGIGYAYTESTTLESMLQAARTAAAIANCNNTVTAKLIHFTPVESEFLKDGFNTLYPIQTGWNSFKFKQKVPVLEKLNNSISSKENRATNISCSLRDSITHILYFNTFGNSFTDSRPIVTIMGQCVAQQGKRVESGSCSRSYRAGFEVLTNDIIEEIATESVRKCQLMFNASQPKGGNMSVVLGSGASGILLHEAVGHAFEADFIRKGTSIFSEMLGQRVCSNKINIVDSGLIPGNRGSILFDDEGTPAQKTYLIREGVVDSFLHDRISAKHFGIESTGNGRREDFRYAPIPRMRCTYMESGDASEEDAIKGVKNGIYVQDFTNGQVQIGEGDFTFFVKCGYLIEDGHLTAPIKDINIIGNGPQVLKDITMVCNNNRIEDAAWTCGKEQCCAVSCGMPSVVVSELTVGGIN